MDFDWFRVTGYLGNSPIIGPDGSVVYNTGNGGVYRINSITGIDIWSRTGLGGGGGCVFTRDDQKLIVATGNSLTALNYFDGSIAWTLPLGSTVATPATAPSGTIVVGTHGGGIYGIDPSNGSILWTKQALDKVSSPPAFSQDGQVAYVCSVDHRLYAFRVSDGVRLWSFTGNAWNERAPSVGFDDRIYFHNKNGDLFCVNPNGTLSWQVLLKGEARGPLTIGPDGTLYVGYTGNSEAAMAMIRQQALAVAATALSIERGTYMSGGLADIQGSDDAYYKVQQAYDVNRTERPIRVICEAVTTYRPVNQISLKLESSINNIAVDQYVELYNYATSTWTQIDVREGNLVDTVVDLNITNAAQYCSESGSIKARVSWKSQSATTGSRLVGSIDQFKVSVVPQFQS